MLDIDDEVEIFFFSLIVIEKIFVEKVRLKFVE